VAEVRIAVRVTPGARRPSVGGRWGDEEPPRLRVAVSQRAVDGAANRAVVEAVAAAWQVSRSQVALVAGQRSRSKTVAVSGDEAAIRARWSDLLADPGSAAPIDG
jgi:uncharacterized protein YggU (UPF0235/DUF167 family)